ncbi:MAG TPA: SpoIID/LytB domain-containing protein [Vicinamibacterales bacterium]
MISVFSVALFSVASVAQVVVTDRDLNAASAGRMVRVGSVPGGRVTTMPLETYVARVLAGEGQPDAPDAARRALAVAIRTYALANAGRHNRDGFDLCDSTHCQVLRAATPAAREAANATAGRVLTFNGRAAEVFYSASCGGYSESASQVWPGADYPYLQAAEDDVHAGDRPWTVEFPLRRVQQALRRAGFAGDRIRRIEIEERSSSGRVTRLRLVGLRPDAISGDQFRLAVGARELRSTAFELEARGSTLRFTGRGYGHGVGLCVVGAGRRALRGESFEAILAKYFPGLTLTAGPRPR